MQKSAHIASIATRLNDLEQKFDEGSEDSDANEYLKRLYRITVGGAATGSSGSSPLDVEYFFDTYNKSFVSITFGSYLAGSLSYDASAITPFYYQVFKNYTNFGYQGASPNTRSLADAIFDKGSGVSFADYFAEISSLKTSLSSTIFGTEEAIEYCQSSAGGFGLYGKIFGNEVSRIDKMNEIYGDSFGSNLNILDLMISLRNDIDDLSDEFSEWKLFVNSMNNRLTVLEGKINW